MQPAACMRGGVVWKDGAHQERGAKSGGRMCSCRACGGSGGGGGRRGEEAPAWRAVVRRVRGRVRQHGASSVASREPGATGCSWIAAHSLRFADNCKRKGPFSASKRAEPHPCRRPPPPCRCRRSRSCPWRTAPCGWRTAAALRWGVGAARARGEGARSRRRGPVQPRASQSSRAAVSRHTQHRCNAQAETQNAQA